jgi:hypothetical protein
MRFHSRKEKWRCAFQGRWIFYLFKKNNYSCNFKFRKSEIVRRQCAEEGASRSYVIKQRLRSHRYFKLKTSVQHFDIWVTLRILLFAFYVLGSWENLFLRLAVLKNRLSILCDKNVWISNSARHTVAQLPPARLLDCLHKCMINTPYTTARTNGPPDYEHVMFEACTGRQELN